MATIHKLTKDGATILPATITDAVVRPGTGEILTDLIEGFESQFDGLDTALTTKADKATGATQGDIAVFNSSGNPVDSNVAIDDIALLEDADSTATIADFDPQADTLWKKAQTLNGTEQAQVKTNLGLPQEIYSKTEVNGLVSTPHQNYVTVATYASLPASGSADTIYRVSNYNGSTSQVDVTSYSEYAWNGSSYTFLRVESQIGEVFDISVYNNNAKYADLAAALGTNGANVPADIRRGGMSVKYIQSSDSKYVQYRYMPDDATTVATFTNVANWQGVDEKPKEGSSNLVTSGGVKKELSDIEGVGMIPKMVKRNIFPANTTKFTYSAAEGTNFLFTFYNVVSTNITVKIYYLDETETTVITGDPTNVAPFFVKAKKEVTGFGIWCGQYKTCGMDIREFPPALNLVYKEALGKRSVLQDFFEITGHFISATNGQYGIHNDSKELYLKVSVGDEFFIKANSTRDANIVFLRTFNSNPTATTADSVGYTLIEKGTELMVEIPEECSYLAIASKNAGFELLPEHVLVIGKEEMAGYNEVADSAFTKRDGAFFSGINGKWAVADGCAFKYTPVLEGEKYIIVANSGQACNYAAMISIPQDIVSNTAINAFFYGYIAPHQFKVIIIPPGCEYLAISTLNVYIKIDAAYIGKLEDVNLSEKVATLESRIENVNIERNVVIPIYGQSLAIGGDATPVTSFCRFPALCCSEPNYALKFGQTNETSKYGLIESYVDFYGMEERVDAIRQKDRITSFAVGQGSSAISLFVKGTALYSNLISEITNIKNRSNNTINKLIVPAFCWIQGEGDLDNGVQYYIDTLTQLRADLDSDIKAITGQTEDVHCIIYQTNQLCPSSSSPWVPNQYESGTDGARFAGSVVAQWKLVRDSQYFHLSSPVYPMEFVTSQNGARIHISGMSQKFLGYYEGLAAKRLMDGHGYDIGLYVTSVTKVDNTHLTVSLHTPCPPVVFDLDSVEQVSHYGFSVITEENVDIITDVAIDRDNFGTTNILITTSADCSGAKLRYGCNGTKGYSGYKSGPRGNVRDSQGLWYKAQLNGIGVPMHNWLMFFEEVIPE